MEKYYKNFILCGEVDYYCLLCQESYCIDTLLDKHLRWEDHRKNIKYHEYVPKFKKDFIYKISDHFYCEICNLVTNTPSDHVKEDNHLNQKTSNQVLKKQAVIKRLDNGSIKLNECIVSKPQWHGILDGFCSICDKPVNAMFPHCTQFEHMVKIIQSEIVYKNNHYYRKLGEKKYYCFTCFKTFENSFASHDADHKVENSTKVSSEPDRKANKDTNNNKRLKIEKILFDIYKEKFSFGVKSKTATCLECQEIVKADILHMSKHNSLHTPDVASNAEYVDSGKRRAELKVYGKCNFITLNEGGSRGYCSLCNIFLSPHIKVFKQHVEGSIHSGHLELKGLIKDSKHEKPQAKPIPLKNFFEVMYGPFNIDDVDVCLINNGICIDMISFSFVQIINDFKAIKGKCYACDTTMAVVEIQKHIKTREHSNIFHACKVLPMKTKGDEEFIREILPNVYHCGYCNKIFPFWETMTRHINSLTHEVQRNKKKLSSIICAKKFVNPSLSIKETEEYRTLKELDRFN